MVQTVAVSVVQGTNNKMKEKQTPILYTVDDIQQIFKIGRSKAYQLLSSSGFPTIKLNKKLLVEKSKLEDWIAKNSGKTYIY